MDYVVIPKETEERWVIDTFTETRKQTIVEMDIPAKPCIPVMEIWMWRFQGIVTVIMNHS